MVEYRFTPTKVSQDDLWYELLHLMSSGGMMFEADITANDAMPLCIHQEATSSDTANPLKELFYGRRQGFWSSSNWGLIVQGIESRE